MNERKNQRITSAEKARVDKRLRATNDLSIAFLRAQSARDIFTDEFAELRAESPEGVSLPAVPTDNFEPTRSTRVAAMLFFYYASLYVVVEGWIDRKQPAPRLTDARIDGLVGSQHVSTLADFRNAVLHPNSALDKRILRFHSAHAELSQWADELRYELGRFFREWRAEVGFPATPPL